MIIKTFAALLLALLTGAISGGYTWLILEACWHIQRTVGDTAAVGFGVFGFVFFAVLAAIIFDEAAIKG